MELESDSPQYNISFEANKQTETHQWQTEPLLEIHTETGTLQKAVKTICLSYLQLHLNIITQYKMD